MSVLVSLRRRVQAGFDERDDYPRWVLLTALVGLFASSFPVTILTVALKPIAEDFDTSVSTMAWVVSAPLIGSAVALPVLGKMGDLYGHRKVFLIGFGAAAAVTAATVFAWGPFALIGMRTLATIVGAATQPTSMALILGVTPVAQRVKALGWWSLVAAGAPAIGLVVGGPVVEAIGWRPVFAVQAVVATIAVLAAYAVLRETPKRLDVGFDVSGAITLALGAGSLMFALNRAPDHGFDGLVATSAAVGLVGFVLFVLIERRVAHPLLPLDFFRRRNFTAGVVGSAFAGAAYMGGFAIAPLVLQAVFDFPLWQVSLLLLIRPVMFSACSPIAGHLATRWGERPIAIAGTVLISGALVVQGVGTIEVLLILVVIGLFFQGMGNGGAEPTLSVSMANAVDEHDLGIAAASQRMSWQVGSGLGVTVLVSIYGDTGQAADLTTSYLVGAALGAVAIVASFFLRSTPRDHHLSPELEARELAETGTPAEEPGVIAGR